jgi:transcription elongation factor Elf1
VNAATPTPLTEAPAPTRKGGGETVKKPPFGAFSPYNTFFYCPRCTRWVAKTAAKRNARGYPCCPYCGSPLRTKPRNGKGVRP